MIFQLRKTKVRLSFSFVALTLIMILLCDERIVLYSLASSLIHESGHLFFMYVFGDIPKSVELSLFGMRIDRGCNVNLSYCKEIFIALGGIFFNISFACACYIIYTLNKSHILLGFSVINMIIAAVNSFPVSVLDSGRAVRYALLIFADKESSEKYADCISKAFVIIFTAVSVLYFQIYGTNISLFVINIYLVFVTIIKKWS